MARCVDRFGRGLFYAL